MGISGEKTGIMICGHGSRSSAAVDEFRGLAASMDARYPDDPVEFGFLEFARPIIRDGLDALVEKGVTRVFAVPGMLFAAGHVKNDIASVLNAYAATRRDEGTALAVEFARDLGIDPKMLAAARVRIEQAERDASGDISREDTMLMVVGRGTSDPDANGNIAKIARMLGEGMGFGWTETCYSGVTFPLVAPGLEHALKLGYRRIVVFPYFLFTGILVERIYTITDQIAAANPAIDFVKAGYLGAHELVVDTFVDRVNGIATGDNAMNCLTCMYREKVVGFEAMVGQPQHSHHHHVEGIGTGDAPPDHKSDHEHDHPHTHPVHPHADHPHGPGKRDPQTV
ncbi:MAG: sirohydrochlorin chelatase [Rhodospirillaceae bacterium]|jgi:sirohydrochlorin cobaltochelatase|nr:sirohydrochlorin chelatase [Rhodospirillaceae bacterium]MBT5455548.1 sirohydrochlorin chelatase [Rhodospirillaceae bacterium]